MIWAYIKVRRPAFTRETSLSNSRNLFVGSMIVTVIGRVHPTWVCQGEPLVPSAVGRVCASLSPSMFIMPMAHYGTPPVPPRSTLHRVLSKGYHPTHTHSWVGDRLAYILCSCFHCRMSAPCFSDFSVADFRAADAIRMRMTDVWPNHLCITSSLLFLDLRCVGRVPRGCNTAVVLG